VKITFILNVIENGTDGVSDYTQKLAREFEKAGHSVFFIATSNPWGRENVYEIDGWGFSKIVPINRILDDVKPDWVVVQYVPFSFYRFGFPFWLCVLGVSLRLRGFKIAIFFHEVTDRFYFPDIKRTISSLLNRLVANTLSLTSNKVWTSIRAYQRCFFVRIPGIIPIGSNIEFEPLLKRDNHEDVVISTFGVRSKAAFQLLIAATKILQEQNTRFKVRILGYQQSHKTIEMTIKGKGLEKYYFISGFLKEKEIAEYLQTSDIFVNMSEVDTKNRGGMCLKSGSLAAAFASGLAIVGFKGDMTDQILEDKVNVIFSNYSSEDLASQLKQLIQSHDLRTKMQGESLKFYESHLSWPVIYQKWADDIKI
jgi:glycosyltransferase involved in cell wall biosynthesis